MSILDRLLRREGGASTTSPPSGRRSNVGNWAVLQDQDYFENHPCYKGLMDFKDDNTVALITPFVALDPSMTVVVIGSGYGRETAQIAPHVRHVYGIDVSERILAKSVGYLESRNVHNFTPVLAESYVEDIPAGVDLVYSIVVMQHLTRDLVRAYFTQLGRKLSPSGCFVVQFLEELFEGVERADAELRAYEPSVSWTSHQIAELSRSAGLTYKEVRSSLVTPTALWHWAHFGAPQ